MINRTREWGPWVWVTPVLWVQSVSLVGKQPEKDIFHMAMPSFTLNDMMQSGVHFGHHPRRWNPKMAPYLFGVRNDVHIIDLSKTAPLLRQALSAVRDVVASGGRVLFVGTKRQASDITAETARRCGQYYVNHRWLGGMLTNWRTILNSIQELKSLTEMLSKDNLSLTKKELLQKSRERDKLELALGGIKDMAGLPDIVVVLDTLKEHIAVAEANKLGIPVVGILDSNANPDPIDYPIPGNDDAIRSLEFYGRVFSEAVLDGLQGQLRAAGVDVGSSATLPDDQEGAIHFTASDANNDGENADAQGA